MKPTALFLFSSALFLQSCAVSSTLTETKNINVTHEHRVNLPAALYSAGSSNLPLFDKKGDVSLAVDITNSGTNHNNDSNSGGNASQITQGISYQDISETKTFSFNTGYALTDEIGLLASLSTGKKTEEYRPYIESWNLTQDVYTFDYWVGIPITWDVWAEDSWQSTGNITTVNQYKKVGKSLTRSYKYFDSEVAVGRYSKNKLLKTGLYGGLGLAKNQFEGHMDRDHSLAVYAKHDASFFKVFVLPSIAFSTKWVEFGTAIKGSFMNYRLKSANSGNRTFQSDGDNLFFVEPSMFIRIGPRAFRVNLEQKWLSSMGNAPFPINKSFTSVGIVSLLNVKR